MNVIHTGTISERDAKALREEIVKIMAKTRCTFAQACDRYIKRNIFDCRSEDEKERTE